MWGATEKAMYLQYRSPKKRKIELVGKSVLYDEFEQYASENRESLTYNPPTRYFEYKQYTEQVIDRLLQRTAFDTLIETSESILRDYLKLFPFQPKYFDLILQDVNEFYNDLHEKGPFRYGLSSLHRILRLAEPDRISRHFSDAENMIKSGHSFGGHSYDDIFSIPREELYGHIAFQPQSLLYHVHKLNARVRYHS